MMYAMLMTRPKPQSNDPAHAQHRRAGLINKSAMSLSTLRHAEQSDLAAALTGGPKPSDLYAGLRITVPRWFERLAAFKGAQHAKRVDNRQWYPFLLSYCSGHAGLTNVLTEIPVAQRNTLDNIMNYVQNALFPDGQPEVAANALANWHQFRDLPDPDDPLAVLEALKTQLRDIDDEQRPDEAAQVRHLIEAVSDTNKTILQAANPETLDAAATILRQRAALRLPGVGRPTTTAPQIMVPVFSAMGNDGDPFGNRVNPAAASGSQAPRAQAPAPHPKPPTTVEITGPPQASMIHVDTVRDLMQGLTTNLTTHMQKALKEQEARWEAKHGKQVEAVTASINSLEANLKRRPGSPPCGNNYRDDHDDYRTDKRGKYGERQASSRECRHCKRKNKPNYDTHHSDDCFQHPNEAIAQRNWERFSSRPGFRGGKRPRYNNTNPSGGGNGGRSIPRGAAALQDLIDKEATKRVKELKDKAEQDSLNYMLKEMHQDMLRRNGSGGGQASST